MRHVGRVIRGLQLNLQLPRSLIGRGRVTVVVTVDGRVANSVGIQVR